MFSGTSPYEVTLFSFSQESLIPPSPGFVDIAKLPKVFILPSLFSLSSFLPSFFLLHLLRRMGSYVGAGLGA